MRNSHLMITVPAKDVDNALALANGYTVSRGQWIGPQSLTSLRYALYDAGYESYDDEPIPELKDYGLANFSF